MFLDQNTNQTTTRIIFFVLDVENPEFKKKLDRMVDINQQIIAIGESQAPSFVKNLQRIPLIDVLVSELITTYFMPPVDSGSLEMLILSHMLCTKCISYNCRVALYRREWSSVTLFLSLYLFEF